jgi:hypothetical protein
MVRKLPVQYRANGPHHESTTINPDIPLYFFMNYFNIIFLYTAEVTQVGPFLSGLPTKVLFAFCEEETPFVMAYARIGED